MKISNTFFALMGATLLSANALADPKAPNLVDYDVNGDGIDEQAYELKSADDLYWFANLVNGKLVDVEQNKSANAVLTANITVNENLLESLAFDEDGNVTNKGLEAWFPIGYFIGNPYTDIYFGGTFDGNGHTISGLYFNNDEQGYVGLFGQINGGATIKNVGVIDSYFSSYQYVGGVCGYNGGGSIENCYNTGKVSGVGNIGGVCGANYNGTIENCYNTGKVSGGNESSSIGGVCGYNDEGTIENCYNTGEVSGGDGSYCIVGVCGYNYKGTIKNCYNSGEVSGGVNSEYIGGVCGCNSENGTIENCYNSGEVSGDVYSEYIGGVCGCNYNTITNCYDFKLNGGTLSGYSIVVKNNAIALPTEDMVSLKGYKFGGWYDNADCEGDGITSEVEFDDDEHILYAKWIEGSTPTAIKAVEAESNKTIKTIKDGQIVIIRNGVMYDMQGRKL